MVKALVLQFRRSRRDYTPRHFLIEIPSIDNKEKAKKFVGKDVEWTSPGKNKKVIKGKIAASHGNKGVVRAIFEIGLPGQAIGTACEVLASANNDKPKKSDSKISEEVKA